MQVMQQVIMMEMVMLLVLLAMVMMERGIFYENSLRAARADLL